jgi:hypothetical protein
MEIFSLAWLEMFSFSYAIFYKSPNMEENKMDVKDFILSDKDRDLDSEREGRLMEDEIPEDAFINDVFNDDDEEDEEFEDEDEED